MKRRIKKKPIIILVLIVVLIIGSVLGIKNAIETSRYHKTYEYKFLKLEYTLEEFNIIDKLTIEDKDYLLTIPYNRRIPKLINEKYFIESNLKDYISLFNKESDLSKIVSIVNVGANNSFYTNTKKTNIDKKELMLTNKYNYLEDTYDSKDMVKVSNQYSYGENQMLTSDTFEAFKNMFNEAKKDNITLIINSSYRSYSDQESVYERYKNSKGEDYADSIAARPGYSEHQTGYAIDLITYGATSATFEETEAFNWLQSNAYKYGFILRYPKDKDYLTGYSYESWHYRYVGTTVAKYIHDNNITFDEYYAYFIEGGSNVKEN